MGYALKLGSVDFSDVAVGQVTLIDPVPCTALALDNDTLSFESVGEEKTLTATKTPANTTDTLTWGSSDTNVATVSNGVVTILGIGTATITATCGNQTATCSINQTTIKAQYSLKLVSDKAPDGYDTGLGGDIINLNSTSGQKAVGQPYTNNNKLRILGGDTNDVECVPVPYGATKCKIKTSDDVNVSISYWFIVDTNDIITYGANDYPKKTAKNTFFSTNNGATVEYGDALLFRPLDAQAATLSYIYFE